MSSEARRAWSLLVRTFASGQAGAQPEAARPTPSACSSAPARFSARHAGSLALARSLLLAVPLALTALPTLAFEPVGMEAVPIETRPIERFSITGNEVGVLRFASGLVLARAKFGSPFTSLSGLARMPGEGAFLSVTDRGHWVRLEIERGANGAMTGASATLAPIDADIRGRRDKGDLDAEAVAFGRDGSVLVAFERRNRVLRFRPDGTRVARVDHVVPDRELRRNQGFESIAVSPGGTPLDGASVVIAERSVDPLGNVFGAVLDGPRRGVFTVRRTDGFDVTDAAFLPGGDLVILERAYDGIISLRMRLRRIAGRTIRAGAVLDGKTLMETGLEAEIDNMEGLAIHEDGRGTVLTLVSDDNGSFLQRTLLLEFVLAE